MSIEAATYISDLDASKPGPGDLKSEGDDVLRLIKSVLKSQFPALGAAAIARTAAELNTVIDRSLRAGDTYTGVHDFTGASLNVGTQTPGDNTTKAASTAFVIAAAFAAALPAISAATKDKAVVNDGVTGRWDDMGLSAQSLFFGGF